MQTTSEQRQIAIPWLARLRWIAILGQALATLLAMRWLDLRPVLPWIGLVLVTTAVTNVALQVFGRHRSPRGMVPAVICLDVLLFTLLLYLTGGTDNPFCIVYAIHVAMTVVVLGTGWAWSVIGLAGAGYLAVHLVHRPIPPLPPYALALGNASALLLSAALITYFTGRVMRELRRRELELNLAREAARQTEHLAALTTLAAGAAHELGTPLSTIALIARELERGFDQGSISEDAQLIRREVERCRQILDRMRVDVIEDSQHRPGVSLLGELIEQLKNDLRPADLPMLSIETTEPMNTTISHARVLRRAIGVLLRNAFDASGLAHPVRLLFSLTPDDMIFQVIDRGAGMSQHVLRRAGEPFFTTKAAGAGMGLGLFLVRLAATTYGGRFELNSSPGSGTQALLALPPRGFETVKS